MRTLLLMRHAKSSWAGSSLADEERPLNKRGKAAADRMGKFLRERSLGPDLIFASSAKRTRQTAKRLKKAGDFDADIIRVKELYLNGLESYLRCIEAAPTKVTTLLVVGHNPDMESLVSGFAGSHERMPTGAVAHIEIRADDWRNIGDSTPCKLVAVYRPKELGKSD